MYEFDNISEELDCKGFIKIIDNILAHYNSGNKPGFAIDGGEPLIKDFTIDLLEYLNSRGVATILNTNLGLATTHTLDRLAKLTYVQLHVSVDGYGKMHDRIRGINGLYD